VVGAVLDVVWHPLRSRTGRECGTGAPRKQKITWAGAMMSNSHPKRPKDPNQLAKSIIDIATGQDDPGPSESGFTKRAKAGGPQLGPGR
jgi:hypothetical protein